MSIFSGDTKKRFSIKAKLGLDVVKLGVIKLGVFTIQQYRRSLVSFTQNWILLSETEIAEGNRENWNFLHWFGCFIS